MEGENTLTARALTGTGTAEHSITLTRDTTDPVVSIDWPEDGTAVNTEPITVTGEVEDATAVTVDVNGVAADVYGAIFVADGVELDAGSNTVTATATDAAGNVGSDSVTVTFDTTAPDVAITSHVDDDVVHALTLTVSGTCGTDVVYLTVNGIWTEVVDGTWQTDVYLPGEGQCAVTVVAEDAAGNEGTDSVTLQCILPPEIRITEVVWSPRSTDEQAKVRILGTIDDATAEIEGMSLTAIEPVNVTGVNNGDGTFMVDGVDLFAGQNAFEVTATDAHGLEDTDSVIVIGEGIMSFPEGDEIPEPDAPEPPPVKLVVSLADGTPLAYAGPMAQAFDLQVAPTFHAKVWKASDLRFDVVGCYDWTVWAAEQERIVIYDFHLDKAVLVVEGETEGAAVLTVYEQAGQPSTATGGRSSKTCSTPFTPSGRTRPNTACTGRPTPPVQGK
jgi:hypothetical protein